MTQPILSPPACRSCGTAYDPDPENADIVGATTPIPGATLACASGIPGLCVGCCRREFDVPLDAPIVPTDLGFGPEGS